MIDWDALVIGPAMDVFGEPVIYTPATGSPFTIHAIFDEAFVPVELIGESDVISVRPVLGIRLADFPVGYDPQTAQGDRYTVRGRTYVVKAGKPDSHGGARLDANLA